MTKHIDPQKLRKAAVLTRSERRAANTDTWVKQHLSEERDAEDHKRTRLRALREARDATLPAVEGTRGEESSNH